MTETISDLPEELVVEILSRVPMTSLRSLRSTCKKWNALSRNWIFGKKAEAKNQFLGFMMKGNQICSVRIDLQRIHNDGDDSIDLSIKHIRKEVEVYKAYHCDGLILLWTLNSRLVVWNPYLGQKRFIPTISNIFGSFAFGYDNNRNHKILHVLDFNQHKNNGLSIYEFSSDSWRVLDLTPNGKIATGSRCVTLKGNAYFYLQEKETSMGARVINKKHFLLCFDFTSERFGPRLSLPFDYYADGEVILSCVRDKQLAVLLYRPMTTMKIWVTNRIDYDEMLWTKWMQVDEKLLVDLWIKMRIFYIDVGSFVIDEEKKVAVVFIEKEKKMKKKKQGRFNQTAYIFGQDGYFKSIDVGEYEYPGNPELFGYFPSLVQI